MRQLFVLCVLLTLMACVSSGANSVRSNPALKTERSRVDAGKTQVAIGFGYLERNNNEEALKRFERALTFDPKSYDAHTGLGVLFERIGRVEQAETAYRRAVKLGPKRGALRNNLGQFLCRHGQYKDASVEFALALDDPFYPTPAVAAANAGSCARLAGDFEGAERFLRIALQRNPESTEVLLPMAYVLIERNEAFKARAYIQRYEAASLPLTEEFYRLAIRVEKVLGDAANAETYRQRMMQEFPNDESAPADIQKQPTERTQ